MLPTRARATPRLATVWKRECARAPRHRVGVRPPHAPCSMAASLAGIPRACARCPLPVARCSLPVARRPSPVARVACASHAVLLPTPAAHLRPPSPIYADAARHARPRTHLTCPNIPTRTHTHPRPPGHPDTPPCPTHAPSCRRARSIRNLMDTVTLNRQYGMPGQRPPESAGACAGCGRGRAACGVAWAWACGAHTRARRVKAWALAWVRARRVKARAPVRERVWVWVRPTSQPKEAASPTMRDLLLLLPIRPDHHGDRLPRVSTQLPCIAPLAPCIVPPVPSRAIDPPPPSHSAPSHSARCLSVGLGRSVWLSGCLPLPVSPCLPLSFSISLHPSVLFCVHLCLHLSVTFCDFL